MNHRTAEKIDHTDSGNLLSDLPERHALKVERSDTGRNPSADSGYSADSNGNSNRLAGLQALSRFGKMVIKIARSGIMNTHQIQNICWREVDWQRPFELDSVLDVMTQLSGCAPRGAVIWEIRGSKSGIRYLLGADRLYIGKIENIFRPHGKVQFSSVKHRVPIKTARLLKTSHPSLSLNTELSQSVTRAVLAAMSSSSAETVIQIVLGRGYAPTPTPADIPDPHVSWLNIIMGSVSKATAEGRKTIRQKAEQHGFQAAIRIGAADELAVSQLQSLFSALKILESAGVRIHYESENPDKLNSAYIPWHFPIQRLSVKELANFLMLPAGEEELPGTAGLHLKVTLPPYWYRSPTNVQNDRSFAVSMNTANPVKLSISPTDALEHTHLIGPTGSGKSTAMQHLILADIRAGRSVLLLDPKSDLVNSVLSCIPENRIKDVVVIDPSDCIPVGFNPLAFKSYRNKALIADATLSVLKSLWADSWGVRIQDILSASLLTLAEIDGASLLWLTPLLTDSKFRKKITKTVKDKIGLQPFWKQFEALSEAQRRLQIEPVLNKLRQFLLRPGLRNVLGQAHPKFDLTELFMSRKIVLVPLNKGIIGGESARLLGSLIVGLTWTLALSRASLPPERRHIVGFYIDELQDYLSLPTDLSDALAQARGLGLALTLAHQYRDQLPVEIRAGIDANCRNKIVFGLNSKDAKEMAAMSGELTPDDFMALPRYCVYTSFQAGGRNVGWVQGRTLPPMTATTDPVEVRAMSMETYGVPAEEVENEYLKIFPTVDSTGAEQGETPIGRRKR